MNTGKVVDPKTGYYLVSIPTGNQFVEQWYNWICKQVFKHFKRNKDRARDTIQIVNLRLLHKETIGRWFFRHLTDELVDRTQAEKILGGSQITFISNPNLIPVHGHRGDPNSLWRIQDLLNYAKFDYERYYYSIQKHTLSSERFLKLLGYQGHEVGVLESLYRQGKIKPSELTEHACREKYENTTSTPTLGFCEHPECAERNLIEPRKISLGYCNIHSSFRKCSVLNCGQKHFSRGLCQLHYSRSKVEGCPECDAGRKSLLLRGLSLNNRWTDPTVASEVMKLRWNDEFLKPFLREWQRQNTVSTVPDYIIRLKKSSGIESGLLAYAEKIITNAVFNDFKSKKRTDDLDSFVVEGGAGPEFSNSEKVSYEVNDSEDIEMVHADTGSLYPFSRVENLHDAAKLLQNAGLTKAEMNAILGVDISESPIKDFAKTARKTVQQVHKIRNSAIEKLKWSSISSLDLR